MARTEEERERLKEWAVNWRPQPTHDRLNRYRKVKFESWTDYHKNRVVLNLTPSERARAESIFRHLYSKHYWEVKCRPGYWRILWANAVSRCRKKVSNRREKAAFVSKLSYWHDRAHREGVRRLGIRSLEKRGSESTEILDKKVVSPSRGFSTETTSKKQPSPSIKPSSANNVELDELLAALEDLATRKA